MDDYSQTVNRFTMLDVYPLPKIEKLVNKVVQYKIYCTVDLKFAYHQLPIFKKDKIYAAFEANEKPYQLCWVPFGITELLAFKGKLISL